MTPGVTINAVQKKFALVVPTLNEAENIVTVLDRAREALSQLPFPWEILVVDDDSTDGTAEAVRRYSEAHSEIRLVERHGQKGLAGAITYGWGHTDADVLGVMDADLQHPPELLPELVTRVCQGTDIAIASRYLHVDSMAAWNLPRRMISRLSVLASKPVQRSGLRVKDPMSGFFVLRRQCIEGIHFQPGGFKLLLEILAKGRIRSLAEIHFEFGTRSGGKSKANGMTAIHYLSLLCRLSGVMVFGRKNSSAANHPLEMLSASRTVGGPSGTQRSRSLEVILGLLPLVLGLQLLIWLVYLPVALRGDADFRAYYSAGHLVRSGYASQLYDFESQRRVQNNLVSPSTTLLPFIHPPYESLLFVPLTFFSYRTAYLLFLGLNLFCILVCYQLLRRRLWRLHSMWRWFPLLLIVGFMPVAAALMQGQDSLIFFLLLAAALAKLEGGTDLMAGALLGLAIFRFQMVLPIALLFLIWQKWRFVGGACISAVPALAVSGLVAGTVGLRRYMSLLSGLSIKLMPSDQALYGVAVARMPNLRGLVFSILHLQNPAVLLATALSASIIVMLVAGWVGHRASPDWQLALAITAASLVGYHVLTHDLSVLLVPIAVLLSGKDVSVPWIIPVFWLSTGLCFFARDYLVALSLLGLFVVLVLQARRQSSNNPSEATIHGLPALHGVL